MAPVGWDSISPSSFIVVAIICVLAATVWIVWLRHSDSYAGNKRRSVSPLAFFIAGIASAPMSVPFTYLNPFFWSPVDGPWYHLLVVGPSEEASKLAVVVALAAWKRAIKEPLDALIFGAAAGIGFAILENLGYGMEYGVPVLIIRSALSVFSHMGWTAFAAYGFYALKYDGREVRPLPRRLVAWAGAAFMHGLSNAATYYDGFDSLAMIMKFGYFIALLVALSYERGRSAYRRYGADEWRAGNDAVSRALREDPDDLELLVRRGYYRLCGGRFPEAKRDLAKAASLAPQAPEPRAWAAAAGARGGRGGDGAGGSAAGRVGLAGRAPSLHA